MFTVEEDYNWLRGSDQDNRSVSSAAQVGVEERRCILVAAWHNCLEDLYKFESQRDIEVGAAQGDHWGRLEVVVAKY